MKNLILVTLLVIGFPSFSQINEQLIEESYGEKGVFELNYDLAPDFRVAESIIDNENRLLIAGSSLSLIKGVVIRLTPEGTLDSSFADNGVFIFDELELNLLSNILITNTGEIFISGVYNDGIINNFFITSLDQSGELNKNFNSNGYRIMNFDSFDSRPYTLSLTQDNKLLLFGRIRANGSNYIGATRLFLNGTIDNTFAENGYFVDSTFTKVGTKMDAQIDAAGNLFITAVNNDSSFISKLHQDGKRDVAFGEEGIRYIQIPDALEISVNALLVSDDNSLFIGSIAIYPNSQSGVLLKYDFSGNLVQNFGENGMQNETSNASLSLNDADLFDNKIYVAFTANDPQGSLQLKSYDKSTGIEIEFEEGIDEITTNLGNRSTSANAIAVQDNDNIFISGITNKDIDGIGTVSLLYNIKIGRTFWYEDADSDGFGNPDVSILSYERPDGFVINNLDCNDQFETITADCSKILSNNSFDDQIIVYPNPTIESVFIKNGLQQKSEISIYNRQGQLVSEQIIRPGQNKINLNGIGSNTVAYLKIETPKGSIIKRIIIE